MGEQCLIDILHRLCDLLSHEVIDGGDCFSEIVGDDIDLMGLVYGLNGIFQLLGDTE